MRDTERAVVSEIIAWPRPLLMGAPPEPLDATPEGLHAALLAYLDTHPEAHGRPLRLTLRCVDGRATSLTIAPDDA